MKKSYHSMVVPTVAAMTARLSCRECSASDIPAMTVVVAMDASPQVFGGLGREPPFTVVRFYVTEFTTIFDILLRATCRPALTTGRRGADSSGIERGGNTAFARGGLSMA